MASFTLDYNCPPWLEDEALLIENAGEMPEVALAESMQILGGITEEDLACLRAACARGYLLCIQRDLDPANTGAPAFRGLERAFANMVRLERFLESFSQSMPIDTRQDLARRLAAFLSAEREALDKGRAYSAAPARDVVALARALALDLGPWRDILTRIEKLPSPDFIALRALKRLACPGPAFKQRQIKAGELIIELRHAEGNLLAAAALPWHSDIQEVASENQARAELVWSLLDAREDIS